MKFITKYSLIISLKKHCVVHQRLEPIVIHCCTHVFFIILIVLKLLSATQLDTGNAQAIHAADTGWREARSSSRFFGVRVCLSLQKIDDRKFLCFECIGTLNVIFWLFFRDFSHSMLFFFFYVNIFGQIIAFFNDVSTHFFCPKISKTFSERSDNVDCFWQITSWIL